MRQSLQTMEGLCRPRGCPSLVGWSGGVQRRVCVALGAVLHWWVRMGVGGAPAGGRGRAGGCVVIMRTAKRPCSLPFFLSSHPPPPPRQLCAQARGGRRLRREACAPGREGGARSPGVGVWVCGGGGDAMCPRRGSAVRSFGLQCACPTRARIPALPKPAPPLYPPPPPSTHARTHAQPPPLPAPPHTHTRSVRVQS